jgi:hypothetical protein
LQMSLATGQFTSVAGATPTEFFRDWLRAE